jgi:hypothetical protein
MRNLIAACLPLLLCSWCVSFPFSACFPLFTVVVASLVLCTLSLRWVLDSVQRFCSHITFFDYFSCLHSNIVVLVHGYEQVLNLSSMATGIRQLVFGRIYCDFQATASEGKQKTPETHRVLTYLPIYYY